MQERGAELEPLQTTGHLTKMAVRFNHKIAWECCRYVYAGGSFPRHRLQNNLTLQINSGLSASIASASGANVENYGVSPLVVDFFTLWTTKANSTVWFNNSSKATSHK